MTAITENDANEWLLTNASHIKITSWGGKGSSKSFFLDSERNVEFQAKFGRVKFELKKDPKTLFNPSTEEIWKKKEKIYLKKYGYKNPGQSKKARENAKKTMLQKYGVEHPYQNKDILEKAQDNLEKKYGVKYGLQNKDILELTKDSLEKSFGVRNVGDSVDVQKKIRNTLLNKYGVVSPATIPGIRDRIRQTKIKNGTIKTVDGKTLTELAKEKGCGKTVLAKLLRTQGEDCVKSYSLDRTFLEQQIQKILEDLGQEFIYNKKLEEYRPDFIVPNHNLIIEADGLYWHSDAKKDDKYYHKIKKERYKELGYDSLFFRGDEIRNKLPIVRSIIKNKLGSSKRVFARKCEIQKLDSFVSKTFFEENHLMGNGSGRAYGLFYNNELILAMQVRWKNKDKRILDISRFCSKLEISVIGGWSKMIKEIIKEESPNQIMTFVDRRYGKGEYLLGMNWIESSEDISFGWTDFENVIHRMNFPGSSGYENGFFKIWDCGQKKYLLNP